MEIRTVGDLREVLQNCDDDFRLDIILRTPITEKQLKEMAYPYPYDVERYDFIELNDISYSEKSVGLGIDRSKSIDYD